MSRSYLAGSVTGGALGAVTAALATWWLIAQWAARRLGVRP